MRYLAEPRDQIFAKGYTFLFFAKNIGKSICKNIRTNRWEINRNTKREICTTKKNNKFLTNRD